MTEELRKKVRTMIRNEVAARLVAEADAGEKLYRSSNYDVVWDGLKPGTKSATPSPEATKADFVRWFVRQYIESPTSVLKMTPEKRAEVVAKFKPVVASPDKFVELLNKERGLVFGGSNYQDDPDPVMKIVQAYKGSKRMIKPLKSVEADLNRLVPDEEAEGDAAYDVLPDSEKKAAIARTLKLDPTETTTTQSVANRYDKALEHLKGDKSVELIAFLKDGSVDQASKAEAFQNLEKLGKLMDAGINKYINLFIAKMLPAFKNAKDEQSQQKAFAKGLVDFKDAIKVKMGSQEIDVFNAVFEAPVGQGKTVLDMVMAAAKNPGSADVYVDEIRAAAEDVFREEYFNRQTNFNSLGDFIDSLPEVREARDSLFSTVARKRGRPKGATKAVTVAKKLAAQAAAKKAKAKPGKPVPAKRK
jgi:hypothetical protein